MEIQIPSAPEIEKNVLGFALIDPDQQATIFTSLSSADFNLHANKVLFERMRHMAELGIRPDSVLLTESLDNEGLLDSIGGLTYLVGLSEGLPTLPNIEGYIERLKEKTRLRKLLYLSQQITAQVMDGNPAKEIITSSADALYNSFDDRKTEGMQTVGHFIEEYPGGWMRLLSPEKGDPGLSTGFYRLDEMTGGFHHDEIWMIAARPSHGKTSWMTNVAYNVVRTGERVLLFSLEMSKKQVFNRLVCGMAGIGINRFKRGDVTPEERHTLQDATDRLMDFPLEIDDMTGRKVTEIRMATEQRLRKKPVALVGVDYVQLLRAEKGGKGQEEKYTEIATALQQLSKDTHVPLLLLSQLNRDFEKLPGKNKRPSLAQSRGSGSWEQVTNVGIVLHRQEMYERDNPEHRGVAEWIVDKNRDGETGTIKMKYKSWTCQFENIEKG